jgi:2,3-dihydroxybiphenyl 1,2-dioxygenase
VIRALSYIGIRSPRANEWKSFGPDVLGLELVDAGSDGAVRLRNDEASWRIAIHPGDSDEVAYLGWSTGDRAGLDEVVTAVRAAGIEVHDGDADLVSERDVEALAWFVDPFGFRHELSNGLRFEPGTFTPGRAGVSFVTGDGGLGHAVLIVPDFEAATQFFVGVLGFRHSDDIDMGLHVRFLHCNSRHHTLAFSEVPGMVGLHHVMLEVAEIDDVGRAYDLVNEKGLPVAMTLGRHTNDYMTSFYVRTPSGFEIEYGAGGRLIDIAQPWTPGHHDAMSFWGHKPPPQPLFPGVVHPVTS